ncbi:MAG: rRNA maturation RNase YbeY [Deltaproteobacteria bacterium]|nr:rRNA maturation RNase YbeY [bacterium]MCB9487289.1 rRNA maturation RNase YbeY [Deltaproteobacteria bacterium]
MATVQVLDEQEAVDVDVDALEKMAVAVLDDQGYADYELSVVLVDDKRMQQLNRDYMNHDEPTNVLSFSQQERSEGEDGPEFENPMLGDVVISTETCARDAAAVGAPPVEEIAYILVHGIAHLIGYDHVGNRADDAPEMERFEQEMFKRFGYLAINSQGADSLARK